MADFKSISEKMEHCCEILKKFNLSKIKISCDDVEIEVEANKTINFQNQPMPILNQPAQLIYSQQIKEEQNLNNKIVKAPIVGTFYSAPAPDKDPFVKIGDSVKKGDVLFIIESMKLMNEIKSDFNGTIKQIFVENGENIEYDQQIMEIEPD